MSRLVDTMWREQSLAHQEPDIHTEKGRSYSHMWNAADTVQTRKRFAFCLQTVPSLNDNRLANSYVSAISYNTPLVAHAFGDVGYFCVVKMTLWGAAIFVCFSQRLDLSLTSFNKRLL